MTVRVRRVAAVAALVWGVTGSRIVAAPAAAPVPEHEVFAITSVALGERRQVLVHRAAGCTPSAPPCPVLYMPDGGVDEDFPHVAAAVDALVAATRIRPVILVGIANTERRRDLTGPTTVASDREIAPVVGGSAAFRRFIRAELVPEIARRYRASDERAIIGESLAGLFVVETFLVEPALFTHYVALDPSLWWNGGALVAAAEARVKALDRRSRSVFLASANVPEIVGPTRQLAALLTAAGHPATLRSHYAPHPELTHATIFRALEAEALAYALR